MATKKKTTKKKTTKKKTTKKKVTKKAPAKAEEEQVDEPVTEDESDTDGGNVYEDLVNALDGHKPQGGKESDQAYLARLAREVTELDDDSWDSLPEEGQDWVDAAAAALDQGDEIKPCPGRPVKSAAKKTTKKKAAAKNPVAKKSGGKAPAPKARRGPGEPATSPTGRAQQLLCSDPSMTDEQIKAQLDKEGHVIAPSTFQMNLSQVKRVLRFLAESEHLKPAIAKLYK